MSTLDKEALEYHSKGRPGKIEVQSTKPTGSQRNLSLAYSPGVAAPCTAIAKDPAKVYDYTAKGNLVAVISNGTAVLGLGNIGAEASKPVMEGKGILFKRFADIDVFDIEIRTTDVDEFINTVKNLEPTFGGINLEDIKAPECFEIESRLKKELNIPVFHDDQHGTAIITGAALLNACEIGNKKLEDLKVVMNGAGAASVACAEIIKSLGVKKENIIMCDSRGVIYEGRKDGMNEYKQRFAVNTKARTLADAFQGADCFIGLSVAGAVNADMIRSMADSPIVFAMANPEPEILPSEAQKVRDDIIMATGRTDFPNQVNNVLGFPFIFRGALDVRATSINEEMKLAAVHALARLAKEDVPENVSQAYAGESFRFGPDYIIPKPFDSRALLWVAPAVAKAAMESGVAQKPIEDFDAYRDRLEAMQGTSRSFIRSAINRVKSASVKDQSLPKILFPDGSSSRILKAANIIQEEGIATPILLGYPDVIEERIKGLELQNLENIEIIHPSRDPRYESYSKSFYERKKRKGVTHNEALRLMTDPSYFAAMAVEMNDYDAVISGASQNYADAVRPILRTIGTIEDGIAGGLIIMVFKDKVLFFADTTVNIDPTAEQIATLSFYAAEVANYFGIAPKVSMLSFSNFTGMYSSPRKMKMAAKIVQERWPEIIVDGEMQADTAVNSDISQKFFPFNNVSDGANILMFPNLDAGNIAYKLVQQLSDGEVLGPFLMGARRPAHVLQRSCSVEDIVNTTAVTALHVQSIKNLQKRVE
tara:strand:- start:3742 stop:6033 length:2292 start_codon:yes stop_codon:yes gene_type:complete